MKLIGIYDRGILDRERVHFQAETDIDLQFCVVMDTFFRDESSVQAGQRLCYWFAKKQIKAGENVVLYSRAGIDSTENRENGVVFHFFFRENSSVLYSDPKTTVSLMTIANWQTMRTQIPPAAGIPAPKSIFDALNKT